ncbi:hypothetical protein Peur_015043 [Populus x canadensis]
MDSTKPMAKVSDHVCEDIDSTMEWVKEAGYGSLLVHLTGFEGGMLYIGPAKPVKENNPKPAAGPQRPANDKPQDQKSGTGFGCSSRASKF